MKWWWGPLCTRPTLFWIFIVLAHWDKRHVAPLGQIILIPSPPVFALSPLCCMLSGEATNTNFIVFGLSRLWLEPTIYRTRGELSTETTYRAVNRTSYRDVNRNDLSRCQQERLIELSTGTTYRAVNRNDLPSCQQERLIELSTGTTYQAVNRNDLSSCQQERLV